MKVEPYQSTTQAGNARYAESDINQGIIYIEGYTCVGNQEEDQCKHKCNTKHSKNTRTQNIGNKKDRERGNQHKNLPLKGLGGVIAYSSRISTKGCHACNCNYSALSVQRA
jgi:hypothetical protein